MEGSSSPATAQTAEPRRGPDRHRASTGRSRRGHRLDLREGDQPPGRRNDDRVCHRVPPEPVRRARRGPPRRLVHVPERAVGHVHARVRRVQQRRPAADHPRSHVGRRQLPRGLVERRAAPAPQNNKGGPDPIAQGADLVTVAPGQNLTGYDTCFGCTSIPITSITPGPNSLTVAFSTPDLTGLERGRHGCGRRAERRGTRGPTLNYTVTCTSPTGVAGSAGGPGSPITVIGLTRAATYACRVTADTGGTLVAASVLAEATVAGATAGGAPSAGGGPRPSRRARRAPCLAPARARRSRSCGPASCCCCSVPSSCSPTGSGPRPTRRCSALTRPPAPPVVSRRRRTGSPTGGTP